MQTRTFVRTTLAVASASAVALAAAVLVLAQQAADASKDRPTGADAYRLSGPYTQDNLTIFLIHGPDRLGGKTFLTLPEALEQKKFVIHETQRVNQLTMENLSPSEDVIILSGDILKGGQQDRIAQYDLVVPPRSGKLPLAAFCVEHTAVRWMRPLEGKDRTFAGCPDVVCSNAVRLFNRSAMSQGGVWKEVARAQVQLKEKLNVEVKAKESDSSLALSQQIKEVRAAADRYIQKLNAVPEGKADVIGYAFAINGKVLYADVYGSRALFQKVWPRLLRANAIEAVANREKGKVVAPVAVGAVKAFLDDAAKGKTSSREAMKGHRQITQETERNVLFETQCTDRKDSWIRRNYLAK